MTAEKAKIINPVIESKEDIMKERLEASSHLIHDLGNIIGAMQGRALSEKELENIMNLVRAAQMTKDKIINSELKSEKDFDQVKLVINDMINLLIQKISDLTKIDEILKKESHRAISSIRNYQTHIINKKKLELNCVTLKDIFEETFKLYSFRIKKNRIQVNFDLNDPSKIFYNKMELEKVIQNIILNSIESIEEKAIFNNDDPILGKMLEDIISVKISESNEEVIVIIQDSGLGIEEEKLEKIFDFGFSTKERGSGFGLSSVVKSLTENKSSIEIKSPGYFQGATTILKFPKI